jgi:hypothetical protein
VQSELRTRKKTNMSKNKVSGNYIAKICYKTKMEEEEKNERNGGGNIYMDTELSIKNEDFYLVTREHGRG